MKLEKLTLLNYRGFESLELEFEPDINVIAGINGVGKSSILHAIAVMFSRALPEFTPSSAQKITFTDSDISYGKFYLNVLSVFKDEQETFQGSIQRRIVDVLGQKHLLKELKLLGTEVAKIYKLGAESNEYSYNALENYELVDEKLSELDKLNKSAKKGDIWDLRHKSVKVESSDDLMKGTSEKLLNIHKRLNQPIAVYFSPHRHLFTRVRSLPKGEPFDVTQAFKDALTETGISFQNFMHWFKWLEESSNITTHTRRKLILKSLKEVVPLFIPEFKNLTLEETPKLRFIVDKSGIPLDLGQLSDGERGLLAIIFDLTRRLALANPDSDNPLEEGKAVVLIDEIELHLHPSWQRQILRQFKSTFKNCQFIVTTHSPQVIGEVESRCVKLLEKDEDGEIILWTPDHSLGKTSNQILLHLMDVQPRNEEIQKNLDTLFLSIGKKDFSKALECVAILSDSLGSDDPEIIKAMTIIEFSKGAK
jgi:predicted ATP-binding protein involved in virulence